jgi:uncharacterized protein YndB with AHSA1/START domain
MSEPVLEIRRQFAAAPGRVFDAWIVPANWQAWIGPEGITCTLESMEPRVGGRYLLVMHLGSDDTIRVAGEFLVIDRPNRLTFTWDSADGSTTSRVELVFAAKGNGTEMTLRHFGLQTAANVASHDGGWSSAFNKLQLYVERVSDGV